MITLAGTFKFNISNGYTHKHVLPVCSTRMSRVDADVAVVLAGGSYVRCFNVVSGSLLWELSVVSAVSSHHASLQFIGSGESPLLFDNIKLHYVNILCHIAASVLDLLLSASETEGEETLNTLDV